MSQNVHSSFRIIVCANDTTIIITHNNIDILCIQAKTELTKS